MASADGKPGASRWARETARRLREGIESGAIETCPHRPQVLPVITLRLGWLQCPACAPERWAAMTAELADAPATCDRCGRTGEDLFKTLASVDDGTELTLLGYWLCAECATDEDEDLAGAPENN
jgi:hypothetical protein